ncbi:MAG: hypothetical protein GX564_02340 [Oligosphaeraceae bacterium]|nr:hypothetical protein [Oligosphaeraceae bacterium]
MSTAILLPAAPEPFQLEALSARLCLQEEEDRQAFRALAAAAEKLGRPRALVLECLAERTQAQELRIGAVTFRGRVFAACCGKLDRVFVYCATCGPETRPLEDGLDVLQSYWLDQLRLEQLKAAQHAIAAFLHQDRGIKRIAAIGPGAGAEGLWPLPELAKVFALLGDTRYLAPLGVELTESMLMLPEKTTAGLYYAATEDFHSCQLCQREQCPNRKDAFNPRLWAKTM